VRVDAFEWDESNVVKNILSHNAYPDEIEETFYNRTKLRKTAQDRYLLYGVTKAGRHLFVVFLLKKKAHQNVVRVISARDRTKKENSYYLKK